MNGPHHFTAEPHTLTTIAGVAIGERFICADGPDKATYERVPPMSYIDAFFAFDAGVHATALMRCRKVLASGALSTSYYGVSHREILEVV